jgi:probable HAF family extracellular repeat protein
MFAMAVFGGVETAFADSIYSFTSIDVPGASFTYAHGINDSGQIVGGFDDATGTAHGFLDTGGSFTTIDVPGATNTFANGINNSGQIVGSFTDGRTNHGFLATPTVVPEPMTTTPLNSTVKASDPGSRFEGFERIPVARYQPAGAALHVSESPETIQRLEDPVRMLEGCIETDQWHRSDAGEAHVTLV